MRISEAEAVERILKAVADPENASIMAQVRRESKSAQVLSADTGIPLSTVYRKLEELKAAGLIMTQHFLMSSGKKVELVVVAFKELSVALEEGRLVVNLVPSDETASIKWMDLFRGQ